MGPFLRFVRRDARNVFANAISLVVVSGLVILPSLYAWFNIAGSWDPYGNTRNLKVAVASVDEGYTDAVLPLTVNIGESVVAELRESTKIGYVFVSEQDAVEGVRSGAYYAAVVIPKDFSRDMMSALQDDAVHPKLLFYSNEKENAIASIVTGKASTSVQQLINESFTEAVVSVGANVADELVRSLGDDDMVTLARGLEVVMEDSSQQLWDASTHLHGYVELMDSMGELVDSSAALAASPGGDADSLADALGDAAGGVRAAKTGITSAEGSLSSALQAATTGFDGLDDALDEVLAGTGDQARRLRSALESAKAEADGEAARLAALGDDLAAARSQLETLRDGADGRTLRAIDAAERTLDDLAARADNASGRLQSLSEALGQAADNADGLAQDASDSVADLRRLADEARQAVSEVRTGSQASLASTLDALATSIDDAQAKASGVSAALEGAQGDLEATLGAASGGIDEAADSLRAASSDVDDLVTRTDELLGRLRAGLDSGSADEIRTIIAGDPEGLAQFVSAPVEMERKAIFPIANNGSAMAPYYSAMAIWVGGTLMGCLVSVRPSRKALEETGAKPRHAYFGRLVFFLAISLAQSSLIMLGDIFYLGIQCVHPVLLVLVGWACSIAFVNIIYSLTYSFGDVGKAIAVFIMVIQVAGSGGTFPMEMLPEAFQRIYPFLPFVHAENAMRSAICGVWGNDYLVSMAKLLSFVAPALLLGLVLRKPWERVTEWMERKMASTKLMMG